MPSPTWFPAISTNIHNYEHHEYQSVDIIDPSLEESYSNSTVTYCKVPLGIKVQLLTLLVARLRYRNLDVSLDACPRPVSAPTLTHSTTNATSPRVHHSAKASTAAPLAVLAPPLTPSPPPLPPLAVLVPPLTPPPPKRLVNSRPKGSCFDAWLDSACSDETCTSAAPSTRSSSRE